MDCCAPLPAVLALPGLLLAQGQLTLTTHQGVFPELPQPVCLQPSILSQHRLALTLFWLEQDCILPPLKKNLTDLMINAWALGFGLAHQPRQHMGHCKAVVAQRASPRYKELAQGVGPWEHYGPRSCTMCWQCNQVQIFL